MTFHMPHAIQRSGVGGRPHSFLRSVRKFLWLLASPAQSVDFEQHCGARDKGPLAPAPSDSAFIYWPCSPVHVVTLSLINERTYRVNSKAGPPGNENRKMRSRFILVLKSTCIVLFLPWHRRGDRIRDHVERTQNWTILPTLIRWRFSCLYLPAKTAKRCVSARDCESDAGGGGGEHIIHLQDHACLRLSVPRLVMHHVIYPLFIAFPRRHCQYYNVT